MGYGDTTAKLETLLEQKYPPPAYAYLPQVRNGTGFSRLATTADALVMGLWPSRGLDLQGFEIKSFRGDWIKELKTPEKAESIARFCDHWWIVAPDKTVVEPSELPKNWGLLLLKGKRLVCVKEAPKLKAKQVDRLFLAALLRKTQECLVPDAKLRAERADGYKNGLDFERNKLKYEIEQCEKTKTHIKEFEEASGLSISGWRGGKEVGDAVRIVMNGEETKIKHRLLAMKEHGQNILKDITEELDALEKTIKAKGKPNGTMLKRTRRSLLRREQLPGL